MCEGLGRQAGDFAAARLQTSFVFIRVNLPFIVALTGLI